jgi:DNA-binding YbaB/EbfC family protein
MLKGLGNLGDMARMMKAAQEMQGKMAEMQASLDTITVDGQAGGGLVKVTATAKGDLKALSIDPSIFREEDREMVEDLILAAVKDAQGRASERMNDEMRRVTEGLGLPPGMMPGL